MPELKGVKISSSFGVSGCIYMACWATVIVSRWAVLFHGVNCVGKDSYLIQNDHTGRLYPVAVSKLDPDVAASHARVVSVTKIWTGHFDRYLRSLVLKTEMLTAIPVPYYERAPHNMPIVDTACFSIYFINFFGSFVKLRKATISFVMSVCLSVCTEQTRFPLGGFSWNLWISRKAVEKIN